MYTITLKKKDSFTMNKKNKLM